ncbi:MAG TPA: MOSC N-terminal beta barrel domain-containing protein [Solirubrobacterales bacterium]|jgi:uncharacterized protein|nr:MOSC N-terminal beta barrel domain-containing protein [Solirubrobacterales bacterium]
MKVAELWRYPVKALRGEQLERAELTEDGVRGDRLLRIDDEKGRTITSRTARSLLSLSATIGDDGDPLIDLVPWREPASLDAVRDASGPGAQFARTNGGKRFDAAPILAVTDGGLAQLGVDRRRFRPNILLEGVDGPAERDWIGRRLRIGEALLFVREPCERCVVTTIDPDTLEVDPDVLRRTRLELGGIMGVYCDVLVGGEIGVGDPVELM